MKIPGYLLQYLGGVKNNTYRNFQSGAQVCKKITHNVWRATLKMTKKLVFKANYRLMQVKSIAECSKGSILQILSTFIKLSFVIKISGLQIFFQNWRAEVTHGAKNGGHFLK